MKPMATLRHNSTNRCRVELVLPFTTSSLQPLLSVRLNQWIYRDKRGIKIITRVPCYDKLYFVDTKQKLPAVTKSQTFSIRLVLCEAFFQLIIIDKTLKINELVQLLHHISETNVCITTHHKFSSCSLVHNLLTFPQRPSTILEVTQLSARHLVKPSRREHVTNKPPHKD